MVEVLNHSLSRGVPPRLFDLVYDNNIALFPYPYLCMTCIYGACCLFEYLIPDSDLLSTLILSFVSGN